VTDFKQTIISIVNQHGESIDSDFALDIDADSNAVMDLSIERHGDELIVCQYYHQRGDLMRDPEVRFRVEADEWVPVSYRQDPSVRQCSADGIEIAEYLQTWARNLQSQGFLDK